MITKETNILEVIQNYPQAVQILKKSGLGCIGCMMASGETIGEGLDAHGLDADKLIAEMNQAIGG